MCVATSIGEFTAVNNRSVEAYLGPQRTGSPMAVCSATTGHCEVAGLQPLGQ
jgi:hypothetical protein